MIRIDPGPNPSDRRGPIIYTLGMDRVQALVAAARRRLRLSAWLASWCAAAAPALVLVLVLVVERRLLGVSSGIGVPSRGAAAIAIMVLGAMALAGAIAAWRAWRHRWDADAVALEVDLRLGSGERLSTVRALLADPAAGGDPFARAAIADGVRWASDPALDARVRAAFPIDVPSRWWIVPSALAAVIAAWTLVPQLERDASASDVARVAAVRVPTAEEARLERVIQEIERSPELAARLDAELEKARAALDEGANGPVRTPEQAAREAARRTSELQSRLDELRDSADAKAARQLQDALAKLDLPKDDPAVRDLAEALKQGNFEAAKEAMKAVKEKAASSSGMSESDREKMAKALEDTARQLEQLAKDPAAMADALRQAGMDPELAKNADALREAIEKSGQLNESQKQALQQMAKAAESARERMEKMGEQMRQSASQCRNPGQSGESGAPSEQSESSSGAEGGQDAMSQMLSQAETERQMAQAAEAAQGQCQGGGMSEAEADRALQASSGSDAESDASGGRGRKEGSGGGHGVAEGGDREVRKTAFGTKFQKQKGPRQEGDVIARQLVAGQSPTGESRVALEQVAGAIASGYERGTDDDPVPAHLREVHKRYFGDLRRTFEQRGVAPATAPAPRAPTP